MFPFLFVSAIAFACDPSGDFIRTAESLPEKMNKKGDCSQKQNPLCCQQRSAAMTLCTAFLFAGLLKVSPVAEFLEGAFLVKLLFQSAESAIYGLAFFQSDFRAFHVVHPLPFYVNSVL